METKERSDEELLARAVERIYPIKRDDENLRRIAHQTPDKRGRYFDDLRRHYPVRREFQNTTVVLDQPSESLRYKLQGLGFQAQGRA
jgi:erythronate-4-phosphate dehydrogenase